MDRYRLSAALLGALLFLGSGSLAQASDSRTSDKPVKGEKTYLYFRPAPAATSSLQYGTARPSASDLPEAMSLPGRLNDNGSVLTLSPSGKANEAGRGVQLQLRSRVQPGSNGQTGATSLQPSAYDVNVALGLGSFALDAGLSRTAEANRILSQGVNLGLSYGSLDWRTRLSVSDQRLLPDPLTNFGLVEPARALAFELGSSYRLSSRWAISGGVRYAVGQPFNNQLPKDGKQPETRAVFVGTAFSF